MREELSDIDQQNLAKKVKQKIKLSRNEISTIRWICRSILKERKNITKLTELLKLELVKLVISKGRLSIKICIKIEVDEIRH